MARTRTARPTALALVLLAATAVMAQEPPKKDPPQKDPPKAESQNATAAPALAVIVNEKNLTTVMALHELRDYCKMDVKYWSGSEPAQLYLRGRGTPEMEILLEHVYRMSWVDLNRYWHGREFRGEITSRPSTVRTAAAAISLVQKNEGAFSVILLADVPKSGVRVLMIDGKRPGESGYPLAGKKAPASDKQAPLDG